MPDIKVNQNGKKRNGSGLPESPRRILVADDEHLVATGLVNTLKELGYEVCGPVADGEKAITTCQREVPDLALLDIRMPKMDGLAAAGFIWPQLHIPVIIISAYSDHEYVQSGNRAGVFGYLLKPVTAEQLRAGIAVAWGRFRDIADRDKENEILEQRLKNRKVIEQAKWVIVKKTGMSEPDAMRTLQQRARNNRRPLIDVAQDVLANDARSA